MQNLKRWMRAVQIHKFGGPDVLKVEDIPEPTLRDNEVKISMKACGINHLDIWVRKGLPGINLPHIPGSDGAGEIIEVGKNVDKWNLGDEVMIHPGMSCGKCRWCDANKENFCDNYKILGESCGGVQSEYFCIDEKNIVKKPDHLTFAEAASMPLVFMTAWQMLIDRAELQNGEWVLIYGGSSGVGSAAIQIAKNAGANVIATVGSEMKIEHSRKMGADFVLNHYDENWVKIAKEYSNGGLDVVFEHVGAATWDASMKLLKKGGRVVTCGATTGYNADIDLRHLFFKQLSILGSTMSNFNNFYLIKDKINQKIFKPFVDSIFPVENVSDAHLKIEKRKHMGKVVLEFNQ